MTKKTRTILFLFLAILFFLTASLTIFYSLGWRFNWETKKIVQPGIFYFKIWPKNVQIYLNGKSKKKTDFFFGSALIENLLPKKYDIEIKKEGFHSWKKTLEVKEREVTEAKNIILAPKNPIFTIISKEIEELFFSPDEKKIILKEKTITSPENSDERGWALKLFELERNVKSHLIEEKDFLSDKEEAQLLDLKFSPDSKKVLLKIGLKEQLKYYILGIEKIPLSLELIDLDLEKVEFNPKNSQKLLVLKEGILSERDLLSEKVELPLVSLKNVITFSVSNGNIYYLDTSGFLFKTDFSFNHKEKLNIIPFSLKKETEYKIITSNSHIILKEGNVLYGFNKDKKVFEKISEFIKNFKFSPNFKKLVYFNDYEIWILFLEKEYGQPQKQAEERLFLTRFSEKIGEVFWHTNHYLIFNIREKIKIAEIDDRDRINIIDFAEFPSGEEKKEPEIFWNQTNKKLYILSQKNLYASEKVLP